MSVITFSTEAKFEFPLNRYNNADDLKGAVGRLSWTKGDTYTHLALGMMLNEAFSPANGARSNVQKIGIIITDGESTNPTATEDLARQIHERSRNPTIEMFAIGKKLYFCVCLTCSFVIFSVDFVRNKMWISNLDDSHTKIEF